MLEDIGIIVAISTGVAGLVLSIVAVRGERQAREEAKQAAERAREDAKQAAEQAREDAKRAVEQAMEEARQEARKAFLQDRIFSPSLTYEDKKPFYDEYLKMKYNGPVFEYWAKNYGKGAARADVADT